MQHFHGGMYPCRTRQPRSTLPVPPRKIPLHPGPLALLIPYRPSPSRFKHPPPRPPLQPPPFHRWPSCATQTVSESTGCPNRPSWGGSSMSRSQHVARTSGMALSSTSAPSAPPSAGDNTGIATARATTPPKLPVPHRPRRSGARARST